MKNYGGASEVLDSKQAIDLGQSNIPNGISPIVTQYKGKTKCMPLHDTELP